MKETQAIIERVVKVNSTHQQLHLAVDASLSGILPGQSILARFDETWSPYLREQWFPVGVGKNRLVVELPIARTYTPGDVVHILGIVGQPYRFRRTLRNVLFMALDTDPSALIMPIAALLANNVSVTLLLLGDSALYETAHLPPEVEIVTGDAELNWANRVTTIGWADQVFVAVPPDVEYARFYDVWKLFSELRAEIPKGYLYGVFRPLLPCGVGACGACALRTKEGMMFLCNDGPAVDLTDIPFI